VFDRSALARWPDARVLAVPGGPRSFRARRQIIDGLGIDPDRFATVVHPAAQVAPLARLGRDVLIMAGVVVTSNAVIGDHVCVLPNTVIHHDVNLGPWSLARSGVTIAGGTRIGANCYVGSGSSIMNDLEIGEGALVGLGSNVIRDVAPGRTIAGNPARERDKDGPSANSLIPIGSRFPADVGAVYARSEIATRRMHKHLTGLANAVQVRFVLGMNAYMYVTMAFCSVVLASCRDSIRGDVPIGH
jgi:sugar O-acyltransferase (sialic acid O-acetyltransferase NeuD family)